MGVKIINQNKNKKNNLKPEFKDRREARELAVQFLYSLDSSSRGGENLETSLELFLGEGGVGENAKPEVKDYFRFLSRGAWDARTEVDEILLRVVSGWRLDRLDAVDRAILRLMIFEGFLAKKLPQKPAILEAVKIAEVFGSEKSPRFIHGVLAKVLKYMLDREIFDDGDIKEEL